MKTKTIPVSSYELDFIQWAKCAEAVEAGPSTQEPINELLAEHHIMDAVLAAMEREARRLSVHGELRTDYWERVVDFVGNYVHQCHRRKEERALQMVNERYQAVEAGPMAMITRDHEQAHRLTWDLYNGVSDGDWEKVLRAAHLYLRVIRDHMIRVERYVFEPARDVLTPEVAADLRRQFDETEREA
ncbi:MAG: hypothetical protein AAFV29_17705, partial [Myxococcota bacterium]